VQHVINYDMPDDVENYGEFDMLIVWGLLVGFKIELYVFHPEVLRK
jgi:hypothetical protein